MILKFILWIDMIWLVFNKLTHGKIIQVKLQNYFISRNSTTFWKINYFSIQNSSYPGQACGINCWKISHISVDKCLWKSQFASFKKKNHPKSNEETYLKCIQKAGLSHEMVGIPEYTKGCIYIWKRGIRSYENGSEKTKRYRYQTYN